MIKRLLAFLLIAIIAIGIYLAFFGGAAQVTEYRVKTALMDAGLPEKSAACMAERMVDRLTIAQLRKLEGLRLQEGDALNPQQYVERLREIGDSEVVTVTTTSAGLCALGLG